ncbi:MAG: hypothetical protein KZQ83_14915 [gamma proteobacterium symbiont of Taylorina sp.]|nr:hypothetical protein [gamma proteobacterium symbiont of Taylorina sp.]
MADSSNIHYDAVRRAFYGDATLYASSDFVAVVGEAGSFYDRAIDLEDEQANMDDLEYFELASSVLQLQATDVYFERELIEHLRGATIESTNFTSNIRYLYLDAGGYVSPIASDLGKPVVGGVSGDEGILLDFIDSERCLIVRVNHGGAVPTGLEFDAAEAITITGGTGAGTLSGASDTGEMQQGAIKSVGAVASGGAYIYRDDQSTKLTNFWGTGNSDNNGEVAGLYHIDILIEAKRAGAWIQNGLGYVFNRPFGTTYAHASFDLKLGGVAIAALATANDDNISLSQAASEDLQDGTTASIAFAFAGAPYTADVDDDASDETYEFQGDHNNRSDSDVYHVAQWLTAAGQTVVNVDGIVGEAYITSGAGYTVTPATPLINPAGQYSQGGYAVNSIGSAWKSRDTAGVSYSPPSTHPVGWTDGLKVAGGADRIGAFVESVADSQVPDNDFFTLSVVAGDNESADGTVVFNAAIPKDFPDSGVLHLWQESTLTEHVYDFVSWAGGTVTLSGILSQAYDDGTWTAAFWYFDEVATGTNKTVSVQHVSARNVCLKVRNSSTGSTNKIKRSAVSGTLDSENGFAIPASRIPETLAS